jgi:FtsH-binding integral membrane protein
MYDVNDDGTLSGRKGVMDALRLYLEVINLLLILLRIFRNGR